MAHAIIKLDDCQIIKAPWISNNSGVCNIMVRIPPSQRWRRVYLHSGPGTLYIDDKKVSYYVKSNTGIRTPIVLPEQFFVESKGKSY